MGFLDVFTNDAVEKSAAKNADLYRQYGQNVAGLFSRYGTDATGALNTGRTNALGALDTGLGKATGALDAGIDTATGYGKDALASYDALAALAKKYGGSTDLMLDALGVNGPGGIERAKAAFQAGPGYQFQ